MAVDANVLIFERIREEQATGKTLKASLEGGYAKALSAIVDANITTLFVAAILYSFGVGPIKGFAVTLMAGIVASMFSAIVITRIVFDYLVVDRKRTVSYG
jgi:preprotein translocase subunit SecD